MNDGKKRDLATALSDDAAVVMIVAYTRQTEGLTTSPLDCAKFFGWSLARARAAAHELVAHGAVVPLLEPESKDVS